jgi:hypothetical protein
MPKHYQHTRLIFSKVKSIVKISIKSKQDRNGLNWLKQTLMCVSDFI